jgi:glycosyltransferase involved in cell wall biosynthesis
VLNILIVTNGWGVKTIAGGEYHILHVLERWGKEHKVSIIIPKSGYLFSKNILLSIDGYPIYFSSNENEVGGHGRELIYYMLRILRSSLFFTFKSKQNKPDVIIATSHLIYDVLPALILHKRLNSKKSKLVVYVHHILRPFRSYKQGIWSNINLLNEKISLRLCKKADLVFVVNPEIKDALIAKGFDADKIVLTDNGVEHNFIDSVKVNEKRYDGCFCGRIDPKKGVYELVEIWEQVLKSFPESKLVIIGDGPVYFDVMRRVKNKALDKNITFTGFLSGERKISTIKSSKIFVSPSYEEGWGIAVSEAMACGLAVVCYNLSAYKIFGNGIIKVDVGNKEQMTNAVINLIADSKKQKSLADNSREVITNMMDWDKISVKQLREIASIFGH